MLEDRLLLWKLRYGNADALQHIYEKHKNDLLAQPAASNLRISTSRLLLSHTFEQAAGPTRIVHFHLLRFACRVFECVTLGVNKHTSLKYRLACLRM
jgi:hypothetical protein